MRGLAGKDKYVCISLIKREPANPYLDKNK